MSSFEFKNTDSIKLFVGHVPREMDESGLQNYFTPYGPVQEVKIIRDKDTRQHRGCAFVTFSSRECGQRAIEGLNEKVTLPGSTGPIQVKLSDTEMEKMEHKLFISVFQRHLTEQDIRPYFERFGTIAELSIIRGPGDSSRGCAFLKYTMREEALFAIRECDGKLTLPGNPKPVSVKFAETQKQKSQRKLQKTAFQGPGMAGPMGYGAMGAMGAMGQMGQMGGMGQMGAMGAMGQMGGDMFKSAFPPYVPNFPPSLYGIGYQAGFPGATPGAAGATAAPGALGQTYATPKPPDGSSLFIYHLPQEMNDYELGNLFMPFGTVLSAKVFIDKGTGLSKCFGFVTYDNPRSAEMAIQSLNGFQIGHKRLKVEHKRADARGSQPY